MAGPVRKCFSLRTILTLHLKLIINKIKLIYYKTNKLNFGEKRFCTELMAETSPKFKEHRRIR